MKSHEYLDRLKKFKNATMVPTYKGAFLFAFADIGHFNKKDLVGKKWLEIQNDQIVMELDFIAIRFLRYYWQIHNFEIRHMRPRITDSKNTGKDNISILKIINNENYTEVPSLEDLSSHNMSKLRNNVIDKAINKYVITTILKDFPGMYTKIKSKKRIAFDKDLVHCMEANMGQIKMKINEKIKLHLDNNNPKFVQRNDFHIEDNPFYFFLTGQKPSIHMLCGQYNITKNSFGIIKKKNYSNIPKYDQMLLPILSACSQKYHTIKELEDYITTRFKLSERERHLILRKKETYLRNRLYWAILYLRKANLLAKREDGFFYATENGEAVLGQNPSKIDRKFLLSIPAFHKWFNKSGQKGKSEKKESKNTDDLIIKSLNLIKPSGTYLSDLMRILTISENAKEQFTNKLEKIPGMTKKNILYDGKLWDVLLLYNSSLGDDANSIESDLSFFSKHRAIMLQEIFKTTENDLRNKKFEKFDKINGISITEIESEFNISIGNFISLAYAPSPNKISMIREFERIKSDLGRVPTKQDIDDCSEFNSLQYDEEFQSWEHMLERLGHDPWYRDDKRCKNTTETKQNHAHVQEGRKHGISEDGNLEILRQNIRDGLGDDPAMLNLFSVLDQHITEYDKEVLQVVLDHLD